MKFEPLRILLIFIAFVSLIGCSSFDYFVMRGFKLGEKKSVTVGSVMLYREAGWKSFNIPQDGIRQELIYAGIAQNVVQISYRELFFNAGSKYAKPAFNLEFQYDLNTSKRISFRDFIIEIDSATSELVTFTVIAGNSFGEVDDNGMPSTSRHQEQPGHTLPGGAAKQASDIKFVELFGLDGKSIIAGFLIGESNFNYFISQSKTPGDSFTAVKKSDVKYMVSKQ